MEDGERGPIKPKQKSAFPSPPPPVGFPLWTLFSLNLHLLTLCLLLLFYCWKAGFERYFLIKMKRKSNVKYNLSKGEKCLLFVKYRFALCISERFVFAPPSFWFPLCIKCGDYTFSNKSKKYHIIISSKYSHSSSARFIRSSFSLAVSLMASS